MKTKDRGTRTPLKTVVNSGAPEGWASVSVPLVAPVVLYSYNPGDKSWMKKGTVSAYNKWNKQKYFFTSGRWWLLMLKIIIIIIIITILL